MEAHNSSWFWTFQDEKITLNIICSNCQKKAVFSRTTNSFLGKPKKINIVELGPGDGSLTKILLKTFKLYIK